MPRLYLASASPRRRELLTQIGLSFVVIPQQIDESLRPGERADHYVLRLATEKAGAGWQDLQRELALPVLAADTSVVCEGQILGKPSTLEEARTMLQLLSGRTHQVLTAVAVGFEDMLQTRVVSTDVGFRQLSINEIDAYWHSGEPQDKAGAYGIQGKGALFVESITGSYSNVVGLPLFEAAQLLEAFGIHTLALLQERLQEQAA
ncbi:MAG: Maf family protein [Pseudomonadota bacterium]